MSGDIFKNGRTPEERFWNQVLKNEYCWEWRGMTLPNGYGTLTVRRTTWYAHRFAWFLATGEHPDKLHVCHRCDNRRCVRPDHLFLGTRQDNMDDMKAKGRHWVHPVEGEKNPNSKLNELLVLEIRQRFANGESLASLGRAFEVTDVCISRITKRQTWTHLP